MQAYNVEIVNSNFDLVHNDLVDVSTVKYEYDYLRLNESKVDVSYNSEVVNGYYIRIHNDINDFFGVITAVTKGDNEGFMTISYKPFISLFDIPFLYDTRSGGRMYLESLIENEIVKAFVNNTDTTQNISIIGTVESLTQTIDWHFNIKSDVEGMNRAIIGLYDVIIKRAFSEYKVVVKATPNYQTRKVDITIGIVEDSVKYIETNLPNILTKNIVIRESNQDVNKAIFYDTDGYPTPITYYLHTNGDYDTNGASDRITPVKFIMQGLQVEEGQTFQQAAQMAAYETFGQIEYTNLIEIELLQNDGLIEPKNIAIGQLVNIIYNGTVYPSILSGYKISDTIGLIFGSVRLELTELLKGGYFNGKYKASNI